jgi:hypothetical protein
MLFRYAQNLSQQEGTISDGEIAASGKCAHAGPAARMELPQAVLGRLKAT